MHMQQMVGMVSFFACMPEGLRSCARGNALHGGCVGSMVGSEASRVLRWKAQMTCGAERPAREIGADQSGRPGDWNCPSCNYLNFAYRDVCGRCGDEKPSS